MELQHEVIRLQAQVEALSMELTETNQGVWRSTPSSTTTRSSCGTRRT